MSRKIYRKGKQIRTVAEFEQSTSHWFVVLYGKTEKTTHAGWVESWQYHMLKNTIYGGRLYEAEKMEADYE